MAHAVHNTLWQDLKVGDEAVIERVCQESDLLRFAHASGSHNPRNMPLAMFAVRIGLQDGAPVCEGQAEVEALPGPARYASPGSVPADAFAGHGTRPAHRRRADAGPPRHRPFAL